MTFAEVPIGHVFQLRYFASGNGKCGCLIRKLSHFNYQYVVTCNTHTLVARDGKARTLNNPTAWNVEYDQFLAMLDDMR